MTEEAFLKIASTYEVRAEKERKYGGWQLSYTKTPTMSDYLYHEYYTGGMSGGNCWDDSNPEYSSSNVSEEDREFKDLDALLTVVCGNITFLQYKKLLQSVKNGSRTEYEYYGNTSEYETKSIKLQDLYDKLKEMGLI